jgi:hypothetical protein
MYLAMAAAASLVVIIRFGIDLSSVLHAFLSFGAAGLAQIGLLGVPRLCWRISRWLRAACTASAVFLIVVLSPLSIAMTVPPPDWLGTFPVRWLPTIILIIAPLNTLGVLAVMVLWGMEALNRPAAQSYDAHGKFAASCPRCGLSQQFAIGSGACSGCGLTVRIELEEPRCACGYLLFRLKDGRCPECGRPIAQSASTAQAAS